MPVGYLTTAVLFGACALSALRPVRRQGFPSAVSHRLAIHGAELPEFLAALLVFSNVLAAVDGNVTSPGGVAAATISAVTLAAFAHLSAQGRRARPALERAMSEAGVAASGKRWLPAVARATLFPFPIRPPWIQRISNVSYGPGGYRNLLDVYRSRRGPRGPRPVLIHLHGGRFRSGRKSVQARPLLHRFASDGWICLSANYRLLPEARFPDFAIDLKRVLAWVRSEGAEYGADPDSVVVAGSSAGAHIASIAAFTPGDPRFQPGFEEADTRIDGVVCLGGYFGSVTSASLPSAPADYVDSCGPPFLIAHGTHDEIVRPEGAREFASLLRTESDAPVSFAELPGGAHTFDLVYSTRCAAVVDSALELATYAISRR